jgi:hypothetical protein
MSMTTHWTARSVDDFVYGISASFTAQIEAKMEAEGVSRTKLAKRLNKSTGRVSQVLNDPGNLGLKLIVEYARELGMKVSIVAYDDGDLNNEKGPVKPEVFVKCWEMQNCPANLFEVGKIDTASIPTEPITTTVPIAENNFFYTYASTLNKQRTPGVYYTAGAIAPAVNYSPFPNFPHESINSAPPQKKEGKAA